MAELGFDIRLELPGFLLEMAAQIPGEGVTAIVGPSGSGKTTLLLALAGLEPRTTGTIRLGHADWMADGQSLPTRARRIGFVFQDGRLFDHLSVRDNITYGARRRRVAPALVERVTEALGLESMMDRRPDTLSGGEARRVSLARALASGPDILFMDEPLAGLDDTAKAALLPYISGAVGAAGLPVLYVTHSVSEVTALADNVLRIGNGRVRGWGPPPPTLLVSIVSPMPGGKVLVEAEGARFPLSGTGAPGDARRIALPPGSLLLSRQHPGDTAGLAVLPARVLAHGGAGDVALSVAGQTLTIPAPEGSAVADRPLRAGESVWVTLLQAILR